MSNPLKKTHITFKCNLDSRAVTKYLTLMQQVGLVEKSNIDISYYTITQKGIKYRTHFKSFMSMMEDDLEQLQLDDKHPFQLVQQLKQKSRN